VLRGGKGLLAVGGSALGLLELWIVRRALRVHRLWSDYRAAVDREAAKSSFLLLASHELRNPVALVRGYADILGSGAFGLLSPEGRDALRIMDGKLREMEQLIQEMAETARLQQGRPHLNVRRMPVRELLEEALDRARPLAGPEHSLVLEPGRASLRIACDRGRMLTVLTNLIGNAIKYSPAGGQVRIGAERRGRLVRIAVRDEGIGIPADQIDRLFRPFSRLGQRAANGIAGTGVGLYLAREIARAHAGDLVVQANAIRGVTFLLTVPAA
jgi:signal transduction histidine kinase